MSIKGLIFDLDGVIANTADLHFQAWQKTLSKYQINYSKSDDEFLKGIPRKEALLKILETREIDLPNHLIEQICNEKNHLYVTYVQNQIDEQAILPGIKDFLKKAKLKNLKLAIASSSKNAKTILHCLNLINHFDFIVNTDEIQNGKPAPDIYLAAAKGLNLKPSECIGFEDALSGIKGLIDAQIKTVSIIEPTANFNLSGTYVCSSTQELNLDLILDYFEKTNPVNF